MNHGQYVSDDDDLLDWASIPECPWIPQCDRLLIPDGCSECDYMRDDVLKDEDGEPIDIHNDPTDLAF